MTAVAIEQAISELAEKHFDAQEFLFQFLEAFGNKDTTLNSDARLRVIFDNGTESNLLMRWLQKALTSDEAARRIDEPVAGPLFADAPQDGDAASGTIYVLRSMSDHPMIAAHRELVHKIGVTGNGVKQRIVGARMQPTFLLADVEVVATYELFNINRTKLENLIHRIFEPPRFDVEIVDRFGHPVVPRELLCCTNQLRAGVSLSPDRLIPRPL